MDSGYWRTDSTRPTVPRRRRARQRFQRSCKCNPFLTVTLIPGPRGHRPCSVVMIHIPGVYRVIPRRTSPKGGSHVGRQESLAQNPCKGIFGAICARTWPARDCPVGRGIGLAFDPSYLRSLLSRRSARGVEAKPAPAWTASRQPSFRAETLEQYSLWEPPVKFPPDSRLLLDNHQAEVEKRKAALGCVARPPQSFARGGAPVDPQAWTPGNQSHQSAAGASWRASRRSRCRCQAGLVLPYRDQTLFPLRIGDFEVRRRSHDRRPLVRRADFPPGIRPETSAGGR
jgi:hypothetical protein